MRRGAGLALACGVAAAVVAIPAGAVNDKLTIFSQFFSIDGDDVGTGGDGSLVLFGSYYSLPPFENQTSQLDLTITTNHTVSPLDFTASPDINLVSNGFTDGDIVKFTSTSDTMPTGFGLGITYHVVSAASDTFQLSATPGGPGIAWTDGGIGVHSFVRTSGKLYAEDNEDLFSWAPGQDHVQQFTVTGDVENAEGTALAWRTHNEDPAVFARTGDSRDSVGTRVWSAAWMTNADPELAGPISTVDEISLAYEELGSGGRLIAYTDSEIGETVPLVTIAHYHYAYSPSVALRTKVTNRGSDRPDNFRTLAITDAWVAFAGNANNNNDNADGNDEIHLWSRSEFLASGGEDGVFHNNGVHQITHTSSGSCWDPAVSVKGDVAFVSDADITGGNADGSAEIFVYRRRTGVIVQVTSISPSDWVETPSWGDSGRRVVWDSNSDPTGENVDGNYEIFMWNGTKIKQVTKGTGGDSWSASMDPSGTHIAFLCEETLPNVVYGGIPRTEIVVVNGNKRHYKQITQVNDGETNERPTVTRKLGGKVQVTWVSTSNLDGRNNNNSRRIYRATIK
jgi:hypothetical protein